MTCDCPDLTIHTSVRRDSMGRRVLTIGTQCPTCGREWASSMTVSDRGGRRLQVLLVPVVTVVTEA